MCGINGIITKTNRKKDIITNVLITMNNLITHRGPDDDGLFSEENEQFSIGMAMRRLSIIDLESGKQPIISDDNQIVIVFNGEIYNYKRIKSKLESEGMTFSTSSDTEVILKAYEKYGTQSFQWLDGMYAFSIYDKNINKLYIARDFFGEKPLYYTHTNNEFIWASELKSIIKTIDFTPNISKKGLNLYFRLTYIPAPHTIYENILKLEANHYIEYNLASHTSTIHKINAEIKPQASNISFKDAKAKTKELVYNSVNSRSIADVGLGTFLSGGVDSSIISLCLSQATDKKIDTFSIGFKKASYDETDKSRVVAKMINSNHHEFIIDEDDLKNNIHEILVNFDEPFSDTASLPTHLLSEKTKEHVTVALTGDGGDEVFGGYNKYYIGKMNNRYTSLIPKVLHKSILSLSNKHLINKDDARGKKFQINKLLNAINYEGNFYWDIISLANTNNQLKEIMSPDYYDKSIFEEYKETLGKQKIKTLTDFRLVDKILSLEGGMLVKVDRTSMMNSLECRAPFLNREIWEFANTLPENYLMKGWNKKHILKEAFRDQFPTGFLEKSKSGFGSPTGDWLRQSLRKELESYVEPNLLKSQGLFNIEVITKLVKDHLDSKKDSTFRVWSFYCFQKWYKFNYLNKN
ncbi:asparagine synthase (glutamine-hydrolysing) [Winogradskyella epiphytica]|uniref:asparagine synthase (glutamine-hydrolyzing) n=1 Tax=Winogradskyella epiphytica TaxID=262005 RepID=A0A2V4WWV0_9FLAO|nr:asparagine synthase (glutamine-hydrolyzing) [Winogradskyella epiphytica]PYE81710.1 asparagine synthase (glutamine-hydrolysing) [Winogradskyella epiphytica]GGW63223.1 asparagine synthetase B [Winogradskyella epiphytica]